jgi:hypothetical protein
MLSPQFPSRNVNNTYSMSRIHPWPGSLTLMNQVKRLFAHHSSDLGFLARKGFLMQLLKGVLH